MDKRNHDFIRVIDREFRRLEQRDQEKRLSLSAQAEFLGMDKGVLSRLRAGERDVSAAKAKEIAKKLRSDFPEADQLDLERELLSTRPVPTGSELEISDWFKARGKPGNLMLVEFREVPAVREGRNQAYLAEIVGRAVAEGLNYGMIFPFCLGSDNFSKQSPQLWAYLVTLQKEVFKTYQLILHSALEIVAEDAKAMGTDKQHTVRLLEETARRLRCYVLDTDAPSSCPAIGYRLFVTANENDSATVQRWEWISSMDGRHYMLEKETTSDDADATTVRFFPLLEYWREKHGDLPLSTTELKDFHETAKDSYGMLYGNDYCSALRWRVQEPPRNILAQQIASVNNNTH